VLNKKTHKVGIVIMTSVLLFTVAVIALASGRTGQSAGTDIPVYSNWDEQEAYAKSIFDNPNAISTLVSGRSESFKIANFVAGRWNVEISPKDVAKHWGTADIIKVDSPYLMNVTMRDNVIILTGTEEDYPEPGILLFDIFNETRKEDGKIYINLSKDDRPTFSSYSEALSFIDSIDRKLGTAEDIIVTGVEWVEMDFSTGTRYPTESEWNDYIKNLNTSVSIFLTIDSKTYSRNGESLALDVPPFISQDGRTMVPIRFIADGLGAKSTWDDTQKTSIIEFNGKITYCKVGETLPGNMGTPVIVNDRLFVPVRYIATSLGADVGWDERERKVAITMDFLQP